MSEKSTQRGESVHVRKHTCGFCGNTTQSDFSGYRCTDCNAFIHVRAFEHDSLRAGYGIGSAWTLNGNGVTEKRFKGVSIVDEHTHADDGIAVISVHDPSETLTTRQAAALVGVAYVTFIKNKAHLLTPVDARAAQRVYRVGDVLTLRYAEIARVAHTKKLSSSKRRKRR